MNATGYNSFGMDDESVHVVFSGGVPGDAGYVARAVSVKMGK